MSTLKKEDLDTIDSMLKNAEEIMVPKRKVLEILVDKLKETDARNTFIVDTIDSAALKDVINKIANIK